MNMEHDIIHVEIISGQNLIKNPDFGVIGSACKNVENFCPTGFCDNMASREACSPGSKGFFVFFLTSNTYI